MPDYIKYDDKGRIVDKFMSVDENSVSGITNLLQVPRDIFNSLTKFWVVDKGSPRPMTAQEKLDLIAEEEKAIADAETLRIENLEITAHELTNILLKKGIITKTDVTKTNISNNI